MCIYIYYFQKLSLNLSVKCRKYNHFKHAVFYPYRSTQCNKSEVTVLIWNRTVSGGLVAEAEQNR